MLRKEHGHDKVEVDPILCKWSQLLGVQACISHIMPRTQHPYLPSSGFSILSSLLPPCFLSLWQWFHLWSSIQQSFILIMLTNYESLPLQLPTSKRNFSDQTKVTTLLIYRHRHNELEGNLMSISFPFSKTNSLTIGPLNSPATGFW